MTDTAKLKDGFYWVRLGDEWGVGVWKNTGFWFVVDGNQSHGVTVEPDEIDPNPIIREAKQ